jgi:hypothetical protein
MATRSSRSRISFLLILLIATIAPAGRSGTLEVTVVDARDRQPINGAFVMVGPSKGNPFAGNTGTTSGAGTISFQSPALIGPQTVTAGTANYAYFSLIGAAETAVTIPLFPSKADTTIYGPKARVQGNVTAIAMATGDGNIDAAIVLPAMSLDEVIGAGKVLYDAPVDTLSLGIFGTALVPGNMAVPSQVELFTTISKPVYHIDLPAQTTQTVYSIAARLPISALLSAPPGVDIIKYATVRELGVERNKAVGAGLSLNINSDINLQTQLTVQFVGAPPATQVLAVSLGSIPGPDGYERIIGYDTDYAVVDSLDTFVLASWNVIPGTDISDASNLIAGYYADTSAYQAFTSGRVDRTPFTVPTTRVLTNFYDPPQLTQQGARFDWSGVATPGTEPDPTWALSSITLGPITPPDATVDTTLVWQIAVPASRGGFALPALPAEAPGPPSGLPDVDATPQADRLIWDAYLANPTGTIDELLERPSTGVTHFSRRAQTLNLRPADVAENVSALSGFRAVPNPTSGNVRLLLDHPSRRPLTIEIVDLQGRRIRSLRLPAGAREVVWDGRDEAGRDAASGIYFARETGEQAGRTLKLQRLH